MKIVVNLWLKPKKMKKIFILMLTLALASCGASKSTTIVINKKTLKGEWSLSNITYSKTGSYNVNIFNDVSKECFEGSTWKFVSNNNTGTYNVSDSNCETGERKFVYVIESIDEVTGLYDFLLKPDNNPTNKGYRLKLKQANDNFMQWQQTITVDGSPFIINMNFTKIK